MNSAPIYVVMAVKWDFEFFFRYDADDKEWMRSTMRRPIVRDRVWGFFYSLEDAKRSVLENALDNFDEAGYYNGAVIEKINEGYCSYDHPPQRWFFRHRAEYNLCSDKRNYQGEVCEEFPEPKYYNRIVGLTMG